MKRILLLSKGLGRGGAERLLVSTAKYVDRSRFEYEVAYLVREVDEFRPRLEQIGVPVHCLDGGRGPAWIGRLRALVGERKIDLVHSQSPYAAAGARLALVHSPVRHVYTEHGMTNSYHRATYWANLLTFPLDDRAFAVSRSVEATMRYPRALRWLRAPPVETLYHGNDPAAVRTWRAADGARRELGVEEDVPVVGTVANFMPQKGHEHLIRAADRVRRAVPSVRFVLIGGGSLEPAIRRQVHELGLTATVVFAGYREDAARLATAFDVFVLPSVHEGFSLALIESMALGNPALVTDGGGPAEIVEHGRHGRVVPVADPAALADGIVALLQDPTARLRLAHAARRRAAQFDIRDTVRRMEAVYDEVLR